MLNLDHDKYIKISFVLPVYNAANTCKRAIDSVLNNKWLLELIIIDDGSTDDTYDICKQFQMDPRVKIFKQKNSGVSVARNNGMKYANGEYIAFIDADDALGENAVEYMVDSLKYNPDFVIFGYSKISQNKRVGGWTPIETQDRYSLYEQCIGKEGLNPVWNKLFRSSLISETFNPLVSMGEDLDFCCAYLKNVSSIVTVNKELYLYTLDSLNSLTKKNNLILNAIIHDCVTLKRFSYDVNFKKDLYKELIYHYTINALIYKSNIKDFKNDITYLLQKEEYKELIKSNVPISNIYILLRLLLINNLISCIYIYFFTYRCLRWIKKRTQKKVRL